jgi:hypothetical protein
VGVEAVFVAERDPSRVRRVLEAAAAARVLTIGEGEEFATQGGVIGLFVENHYVQFDINTTAAGAAGLRISSKLLALTRAVHSMANGAVARP